jgi:hypothetical protein
MVLRIPAPHWEGPSGTLDARCIPFKGNSDFDPWFDDMEESRHICNGFDDGRGACPIKAKCLKFALINNEHNGVWGGTVPAQRHYIRKHTKKADWGNLDDIPDYDFIVAHEEAKERQREARRLERQLQAVDGGTEGTEPRSGGRAGVPAEEVDGPLGSSAGRRPSLGDGEVGLVPAGDGVPASGQRAEVNRQLVHA